MFCFGEYVLHLFQVAYVSVYEQMSSVSVEARSGHQILLGLNLPAVVSHRMWVLGTDLGFSGRSPHR